MAGDAIAKLAVTVDAGGDADPEEIDATTRQLCSELREMGVESVELSVGVAAPRGAKSAEAITLGALSISVIPTMLPKLVEFLQSWVLRGKDRTVKIKATVGDRTIDVEYPSGTADPVVSELLQGMTRVMDSQRGRTKSRT